MRDAILIIAILCQAFLCLGALALDEDTAADSPTDNAPEPMFFSAEAAGEDTSQPAGSQPAGSQASASAVASTPLQAATPVGGLTVLKSDSGRNISEMDFTLYSPTNDFGAAGKSIGMVVRFTPPGSGWMLRSLQILGWSIFNNSTNSFPPDTNILIEIRDKDANLLHRFVDTQNAYFASAAGPVVLQLDVPAMEMTGDFYVAFYNRGSMLLGVEPDNGTGNSFFISNGRLLPAEFTITGTNTTKQVNWLIRAVGS